MHKVLSAFDNFRVGFDTEVLIVRLTSNTAQNYTGKGVSKWGELRQWWEFPVEFSPSSLKTSADDFPDQV